MDRRPPRIAVTGVGIVSGLGIGASATLERLFRGDVGIAPITLFDTSDQRCRVAAQVPDLELSAAFSPDGAEAWSRTDRLAVVAARDALSSARLEPGSALAIAVGGTTGGMLEAEELLARTGGNVASEEAARQLLGYPLSTPTERVARAVGMVSDRATVCSACSSGANAIVVAASWILGGRAERALAGGADALCRLTLTGFNALGATDVGPCRPFDQARAGLSLGEGAGFLVLESESSAQKRNASVLAWLDGWHVAAEAHHITQPDPSADTIVELIGKALARAGLAPGDVDYVNAHGTATEHNDAVEALGLRRALHAETERVWVSSSKAQLGHTLGAAGGIEAAVAVDAVHRGRVFPTAGLQSPDPTLPLRHVIARGRVADVRVALSSSFGFGGTGCVLAFCRADVPDRRPAFGSTVRRVVTAAVSWSPAGLLDAAESAALGEGAESWGAAPDALRLLEPARSRRFDAHSATVTAAASRLLAVAKCSPEGVGLVTGAAYGNVTRSVDFLAKAMTRGVRFASPADFPHLVPSAASGNASIYLGLSGPVISTADLALSAQAALALGDAWLCAGLCSAMIVGAAEPGDPIAERVLTPLWAHAIGGRGEGGGWLLLEDADAALLRGGVALAELLAHGELAEGTDLGTPTGRGLVVDGGHHAAIALPAGAWHDVPRRPLPDALGNHEARGALALCLAMALLCNDEADDVLVLGQSGDRRHYARFVRPRSS